MKLNIDKIKSINEKRLVSLPDRTMIPALGQGTWYLGESNKNRDREIKTLKLGIELGMTLIDTAEMYGDGGAEELVNEAIKGVRDKIFLVSKVYPHNAGLIKITTACENSLKRLGTDHLDMYLLHWRGRVPLQETIEGMEKLKKQGKILRWGVSNFDTDDMKELWNCEMGTNCTVNQVLYHLGSRGIEFDLLPWQRERNIPVMAYCPIAKGGNLRRGLLNNSVVMDIAEGHSANPVQILLAWAMHSRDVVAIPKASNEQHVIENAKAASIELTNDELAALDSVYPKPNRKMSLDIL